MSSDEALLVRRVLLMLLGSLVIGCSQPIPFAAAGNQCTVAEGAAPGTGVKCSQKPATTCRSPSEPCWILFDLGPIDAGTVTFKVVLCASCCMNGEGGFSGITDAACTAVSCSTDSDCAWWDAAHRCNGGACTRDFVCLSQPPADGGGLCIPK